MISESEDLPFMGAIVLSQVMGALVNAGLVGGIILILLAQIRLDLERESRRIFYNLF